MSEYAFLLNLTVAQFRRFRADYRTLTLRYRMSGDEAIRVLQGRMAYDRVERDRLRDEREHSNRERWQHAR